MSQLGDTLEFETDQDGEIPVGFLTASFKNIGNVTATVNNTSLAPGEAKTYGFIGKGRTAKRYSTNGTTLKIMYDF